MNRIARFSCDYCRQKKIRCTKELPKCRACLPWPGPCEYSRDHQGKRRKRDGQQRLSVQSSSGEVTQSVDASGSQRAGDSPAHSFSYLRETPWPNNHHVDGQSQMEKGLRDLSSIMDTHQSGLTEIKEFIVPSRAVGYSMMGHFLQIAEMSRPFMLVPSEDIVNRVIFEPANEREPAWIVIVNYLLLSAGQASKHQSLPEQSLRQNMHLGLNNSIIFLRPSEANIQALAYLAIHGEDFAAPNSSWMLLSHACRQSEAICLHKSQSGSEERRQQRLCLFWLLFMVDKSCALAFGRPAFLPASSYAHVPLPTDQTLLSFKPHDSTVFNQTIDSPTKFAIGAHFLKRGIEFSKMVGSMSEEMLHVTTSSNQDIRERLDEWARNTFQPIEDVMHLEASKVNASQHKEMSLGLSTLRFQYLHALVVLLKRDRDQSSCRLSAAREALSLLPSIISNHTSVYNGVVWHLLYYPFAPFFAIFELIISSSTIPGTSINSDIDLLISTVQYFAEMRMQMRGLLREVCSRLEHVARSFAQLARKQGHNLPSPTETNSALNDPTDPMVCPREKDPAENAPSKFHRGPPATVPEAEALTAIQSPNNGHADVVDFFTLQNPELLTPRLTPVTDARLTTEGLDATQSDQGREIGMNDSVFDWFAWDSYYVGEMPPLVSGQ